MELIGFLENEDGGSFWGEGGRLFLLIEQQTGILSGWNLTLILDPRSRFSRKPKRFALWRGYVRAQREDLLCYDVQVAYCIFHEIMSWYITSKRYKLIYLFFHLFVYYSAFGLKCHNCLSTTSMNDCLAKQKAENCSSSDTRCVTESFEYKIIFDIKTYRKGCQSKSYCDSELGKKICTQANGKTCDATCCEGDLCNTSLVPTASILLMVSCALVVFLSIKPWGWSLGACCQCDSVWISF